MRENNKVLETFMWVMGHCHPGLINHGMRVKRFVEVLLEEYAKLPDVKLSEHDRQVIAECSILHDIGKNALPDTVLGRKGMRSGAEMEVYRTHPLRGEEMAELMSLLLDKEYVTCLQDECRYHHERFDGKGYPDGLVGDEIPISAQIVGLADVYDNLVSERLSKHAIPPETVYDSIINGEAGMFSPQLLACFMRVQEQMAEASKYKPVEMM